MGLCPWFGLSPSTSSAKGRTRGRAPFSSLPFRRGVASPHIRRQSRVAGPRRPLHEGPRSWWLQNDAPASCSDLQAPRISNDSTLKVNFRSILSGRVRCRRQSRVAGPRRPLHEGPRFWWLQNDAPASGSDLQAPRISNDSTLKVNFRSILSGRGRCWRWCRSRLRNPSNFRSCRSRRWNCSSHLSRFQFRCCPLSCHSSNCRFRLLNYQFRRRSNRRFRLHLRRLSCRFQCCPFRFPCCPFRFPCCPFRFPCCPFRFPCCCPCR